MTSIRDEVIERWKGEEFRVRLREYSKAWKQFRTPYTVANVVRDAAEGDRADDLYEVLIDEDFHSLRQSQFGLNELRADLHIGRDYFSGRRPDVLRYMQIIFLEQVSADNSEFLSMHRRHCQGFADFMQLDRLPAERQDMGLHRALGRFFPITSDPGNPPIPSAADDPMTVRLASYELGTWSCSCGRRTGLSQRYEFACQCGQLHGNGRLTSGAPGCSKCGEIPDYIACLDCGTCVTLENLWQSQRGGAHPSVYRVPLILNLVVERMGAGDLDIRLILMYLPLPLGLREREGSIVFELPDLFWLGEFSGGLDELGASSKFVSLNDVPRYDRQTELCKILEAAFRRTLWGRGGGYRRFGNKLLESLVSRRGDASALTARYTRGFENRIGYNLGTPDWRPENLLRFADLSAECVVAASPMLRGNVVLVNRRLADPAALSAPHLINLRAVLRVGDSLTPDPPGVPKALASELDECGVVLPGSTVQPGQLLVGIASPAPSRELMPEERLLRAVFGDQPPGLVDKSLVMTGGQPRRVLAEHIGLSDLLVDEIPDIPGRFISYGERLGRWETAHITITVAVDQVLEVGDVLLGKSDSTAVVCGILGGAALRKVTGTPFQPDLVVSPDHPWASRQGGPRTRVRLNKSDLISREVTSRATGPYSLISQEPVSGTASEEVALGEPAIWRSSSMARVATASNGASNFTNHY
jgi:hypothetical protein